MDMTKSCAIGAALGFLAALPASASTDQPPATTPVISLKPQPTQPAWTKICNTAEDGQTCYITRDFVTAANRPAIAIAIFEQRASTPKYMVRTLLPLGLMMSNGVRVAVDSNPPISGSYALCLATGCFAETIVHAEFIQQLRRGQTIKIAVQDQYGRELAFALPAAGFAASYDGAPIHPDALARQQENLKEKLARRGTQPNSP
ncbi:hypothetical protein GCM10019059_35530 [Camelimonas fluminis]|uniref:Invasion associated locus B family protein n=1 Tax=Camelimonas fluminis TaxID=1576911 RepID=A0ABV7UFI1_9HYPH|nr:invasion associated locus B family protein [Camelimonas fluminis]GHE72839.1 hypothetical protein GCM10019059_35530 [Camelimonas fluminis]